MVPAANYPEFMSAIIEQGEQRKKEKGTKKRARDKVDAISLVDGTIDGKEEKRKKRRGMIESEEGQLVKDEGEAKEPKKKKKAKKDRAEDGEVEAEGDAPTDEKPRKKKKKSKELPEADESGDLAMADAAKDAPEGTTKKKKRKTRARAEEEVGEAEGKGPDDPVPGESRAKVKKHKKNKKGGSEYPNPEKDESLSEQGRKALSYVISYDASREDPSSGIWKFNKARQNWIMRNICDANAVPDSYFQYALKYVQSIQGGARKSLVNHCQTILAPPPAPTDGAKDTTVESAAAAPTDNDQPKPETVQQPIDVQDEMTQKAKAERARVVAGSLKL